MSIADVEHNDLAYWFPRLETAGLRVPGTEIIRTDADLLSVLDGETPEGWDRLVGDIRRAADRMGYPAFLRTGHGSGKHEWARTCHLSGPTVVDRHVAALVEWSALAGMFGLPTSTWVVREMIPTDPLFTCRAYHGFPVTREFRVFVRGGKDADTGKRWAGVEHIQPYWPEDAVSQGQPDHHNWRQMLARASQLATLERDWLCVNAKAACDAVGGGYWSVDCLEDRNGNWWITDMADGDQSFRFEPSSLLCEGSSEEAEQ
jgi:hypothetical protein